MPPRNVYRSPARSPKCATILVKHEKAFLSLESRTMQYPWGSRRLVFVLRALKTGPIIFIIIVINTFIIKVRRNRAKALSFRSTARSSLPSMAPSSQALNVPVVVQHREVETAVWAFARSTTQFQRRPVGRLASQVIRYLRVKALPTRNLRIIRRIKGFKVQSQTEKTVSIVNRRNYRGKVQLAPGRGTAVPCMDPDTDPATHRALNTLARPSALSKRRHLTPGTEQKR